MTKDKNFKEWHLLKNIINKKDKSLPFFHEREIWFCSIGVNIGYEQDGKNKHFERPILIIKKFNQRMFWGAPLTSKVKKGKYYFPIRHRNKEYSIILSQIRLFDSKRLLRKIHSISSDSFCQIKNILKKFLE